MKTFRLFLFISLIAISFISCDSDDDNSNDVAARYKGHLQCEVIMKINGEAKYFVFQNKEAILTIHKDGTLSSEPQVLDLSDMEGGAYYTFELDINNVTYKESEGEPMFTALEYSGCALLKAKDGKIDRLLELCCGRGFINKEDVNEPDLSLSSIRDSSCARSRSGGIIQPAEEKEIIQINFDGDELK